MIGSVAEWAKLQGISVRAAYKRIRQHEIPFVKRGQIDFAKADRIWAVSGDALQQQRGTAALKKKKPAPPLEPTKTENAPTPATPVSSLSDVQLRRQTVALKTEIIRLRELEKQMVKISEVEKIKAGFAEIISKLRDRLLSTGAELRDRLAASDDPNECQRIVDDYILRLLNSISQSRVSSVA